jgi:hypothetical protein
MKIRRIDLMLQGKNDSVNTDADIGANRQWEAAIQRNPTVDHRASADANALRSTQYKAVPAESGIRPNLHAQNPVSVDARSIRWQMVDNPQQQVAAIQRIPRRHPAKTGPKRPTDAWIAKPGLNIECNLFHSYP